MKAGIVGLPNVGKSTLFNCLSNAKAQSANFPFCTIEPNIGVVNVPDSRLEKLEELVNPERVLPATVEIVDIAGLVKGASKGEGLGNKFLGNIRETDAIIHVLRCFDNDNIVHVDVSIDPVRDKETVDFELQLKDLETLEKKLDKVKKASRTGDKQALKELAVLSKVKDGLESAFSVRSLEITESERKEYIDPLQLITDKPVLYVCNVDDASAVSGNAYVDAVKASIKNEVTDLLTNIYKANRVRQKKEHLETARENLELVRLYIRILKDTKEITSKQHIFINQPIENVSKQLAGWYKSVK